MAKTDSEKVENETEHKIHPLPDLINDVLNEGHSAMRTAGWQVDRVDDELIISRYDEIPERGGELEEIARFEVTD